MPKKLGLNHEQVYIPDLIIYLLFYNDKLFLIGNIPPPISHLSLLIENGKNHHGSLAHVIRKILLSYLWAIE